MHFRLLCVLMILFILSGCSDSGPGSGGQAAQKAEIEKWNFYVDFGNHLETDLNQALSEYFKAFGNYPEYKPADSSDYISDFIDAMGVDQHLTREIERALAAAQGSDSELDQVTYEMSLHLKALWARMRIARDYHADDPTSPEISAKARELHSEIFQSYLGLEASYSRFRHILSKIDADRRQNDLKEMREKGLILKPAMLQLIDESQAIQDMLLARGINSDTLGELSLEEFLPYYDRVTESLEGFQQAFDQAGSPAREGLAANVLPDFQEQTKRMVDSLNLLIGSLRLQESPGANNPQNNLGAPENFAIELGILIDIYNKSIY